LTHRDLSLENVMIHQDRAVIIDLGMSLNIPYDQNRQRRMITPQGAAGKMKYMAPEVYAKHEGGFDGFAIDMWAVGVILYIMLTGEVPWQMPHHTDLKFAKFTDGWIEPYLKGQGFPLSANAYCLLQRMLWLNPQDRLCLHQVRAHPWMQMGSFGSPQQGLIRWRSAERSAPGEREDAEDEKASYKKSMAKVVPPKSIQRGKYSKDENVTLSLEDMAAMQECVQKYKREELRPEESLEAKSESIELPEDDAYVKKVRAKLEAKTE
jgi:serine/threonine protein kinase